MSERWWEHWLQVKSPKSCCLAAIQPDPFLLRGKDSLTLLQRPYQFGNDLPHLLSRCLASQVPGFDVASPTATSTAFSIVLAASAYPR